HTGGSLVRVNVPHSRSRESLRQFEENLVPISARQRHSATHATSRSIAGVLAARRGSLPRKSHGRGFSGFEDDTIAKGLEAPDKGVAGLGSRPLVQIGSAKISVLHAGGQNRVGRDENLVADRHGGSKRAATCLEPPVLLTQVGTLLAGGAHGGLDESRRQVDIALTAGLSLALARAFVVPGADA